MQSKTIRSVLRRKIDQWIASIEDEAVRNIAKENVIVTGGAIVSMLMAEHVNDYDIYFKTGEAAFAVTQYYIAKFKKAKSDKKETHVELTICDEFGQPMESFNGKRFKILAKSAGMVTEAKTETAYQYFEMTDPSGDQAESYLEDANDIAKQSDEKGEYRPVWMSSNAITLSDKIQLVIRFWGEANVIHENYDFVHCTSYWQSWDGALVLRPEALESILSKTLIYQGSKYPICSVIRTRKFIKREWRITAGQYLKMCMQISELNLKDVRVLEDQLTGVDAAFFAELIGSLKKDMKEKNLKEVDATYLAQLIDRIF